MLEERRNGSEDFIRDGDSMELQKAGNIWNREWRTSSLAFSAFPRIFHRSGKE
jgi:hypothetical protein